MVDEAFALSPITARAMQPSEEDYDAINQAFMETSRGRWFLGEYAKRNRNSDTRMVLDAVARIEQTLADQKQPVPDNQPGANLLADALAAIRTAVDEARAAAATAVDGLAIPEHLAPVRKGARVIKEISWRWREIGADGRICDLIDSQLVAIESACEQITSVDPKAALSAVFDIISRRIAEFGEDEGTAPVEAEDSVASSSPARQEAMPAASMATVSAAVDAETGRSIPDLPVKPSTIATVQAADEVVEVADVPAEAADVTVESAEITADAADAHDEAVLDLVALEMAASDPADAGDLFDGESDQIDGAALPLGESIIVAQRPEPAIELAQPAEVQPLPQPTPQPSPQPAPQLSLEPSLGSSLIASGIVRRPAGSKPDPLAPIRRMSQAEKIAFFS
jgi:hypothetical protein